MRSLVRGRCGSGAAGPLTPALSPIRMEERESAVGSGLRYAVSLSIGGEGESGVRYAGSVRMLGGFLGIQFGYN